MSGLLTPTAAARAPGFRLSGSLGKAVLLVHGMTGAPGEMQFLAQRLHRRGFSVAAPLLAGHGADEAHLLASRWQDWLGSTREAFDALKADHDEVYVAGVCVGGVLGLALAAQEPAVAGAAVYSMTYRYDGWNMKRWSRAVAPLAKPFAGLPGVRRISFVEPYSFGLKDERLREDMAATQGVPLGAMREMLRLAEHIDRVGRAVTQPTLILHARDDDMSHPRNALRLARALGGLVDLRLLDDCYHLIHVDRQRDLVGDMTADFFGARPRTSAPRAVGRAEA